jgi:uncharacterized membrane protein
MSFFYQITKKSGLRGHGLFVLCLSGLVAASNSTAQIPNKSRDKSSLKSNLINVEAVANETFRYNTTLHNGTAQSQIYQLNAQVPTGWSVAFKTLGSQVTSVNMEPGSSLEVSIELNARPDTKPTKYNIPVTAVSLDDSLKLTLEAVLKGAYGLELSTPTGRLSDEVTEGSTKEIHLVVKNTATLPLENIELAAQAPQSWDVTFEPSKINLLDPNKTVDVTAIVKVPDKTVAGDYVTTFTSKNTNSTANSTFRMTVKTSMLSGWIGILVIALAVGLVYYLVRKYGRR